VLALVRKEVRELVEPEVELLAFHRAVDFVWYWAFRWKELGSGWDYFDRSLIIAYMIMTVFVNP
jgi:hypothetical protein